MTVIAVRTFPVLLQRTQLHCDELTFFLFYYKNMQSLNLVALAV